MIHLQLLVVGILAFALAKAIAASQPHIIRNVGKYVAQTLHNNCLIVSTASSLTACLDPTSGTVNWRFQHPRILHFERFVLGNNAGVFLSSSTPNGSKRREFVLYSLSLADGSYLWEISLGAFDSSSESLSFDKYWNTFYVHIANKLMQFEYSFTEPKLSIETLPADIAKVSLATTGDSIAAIGETYDGLSYYLISKTSGALKVVQRPSPFEITKVGNSNLVNANISLKEDRHLEFVVRLINVISNKPEKLSAEFDLSPCSDYLELEDFLIFHSDTDTFVFRLNFRSPTGTKSALFGLTKSQAKWNLLALENDCKAKSTPILLTKSSDSNPEQHQSFAVVRLSLSDSTSAFTEVTSSQNIPRFDVSRFSKDVSFHYLGEWQAKGKSSHLLLEESFGVYSLHLVEGSDAKLLWRRDEALSELKQAFLISPVATSESSNLATAPSPLSFNFAEIKALADLQKLFLKDESMDCNHRKLAVALSHNDFSSAKELSALEVLVHIIPVQPLHCGQSNVRVFKPVAQSLPSLQVNSLHMLPEVDNQITPQARKALTNKVLLIAGTANQEIVYWELSGLALPPKITGDSTFVEPSKILHSVGYLDTVLPSFMQSFALIVRQQGQRKVLLHQNVADHPEKQFFHILNETSATLDIYEVSSACAASQVSGLACRHAKLSATVNFDADSESVEKVIYPTFEDTVSLRSLSLGDDNVLLKYLNPHLLVVCTMSKDSKLDRKLFINIIDTVSGKLIHRSIYEHALPPISGTVMENFIVVSFWNAQAKRTEVSSIGLYDGLIGKFDFTPFNFDGKTKAGESNPKFYSKTNTSERSSFQANLPLVMQRTYALAKPVVDIAHTISSRGINNRNLLFSTDSGQIFSIDFRALSPRRPLSDPTLAEKEEGLMRYHPNIPLLPTAAITGNKAILFQSDMKVFTAASLLESRSLVFGFGSHGDVFMDIITASQAFDSLSSDFNHLALILLIGSLAAAVLVLRFFYKKATLHRLWH